MSLATISAQDFEACKQQSFLIHLDETRSFEATLIEVKTLKGHANREESTAFTLLFHTTECLDLSQSIYRIENKQIGELGIFLVPVGPDPDAGGMCYEAVFN